MDLKQSNYNFIYEDLGKDQVVFYNSRTGALAVVKEEEYKRFLDFIECGKEIEEGEFLSKLLRYGYLIPSGIDERFLIKTKMMAGRYNKNSLSLTIAPTMACNFRCVYCFEQGHYGNKLMDETTQENLMQFIQRQIIGVKSVQVTWFGGEPLIGMPVIEKLSQRIMALCEEKEIRYSASIITNGYLLTKDIAEKLKEYKVRYAQITIDGPKEIHDARRPMADGTGTYDTIMKNLADCKGILPIKLRINVDVENAAVADEVMENLKKADLLDSVNPYLGLVVPHNAKYEEDKCLPTEVYSNYSLQFILKHGLPLSSVYPCPRSNHCVADYYNGWVIDEAGNLYKCWNDIGIIERSFGNINLKGPCLQRTDLINEYSSFDPMLDEECRDCKMLPVCEGGCPHSRMEGRRVCEQRRYYIQEYLVEYTKSLLAQKLEKEG